MTQIGQYRARAKGKPKDRNCRYGDASIWKSNHKCPARESIGLNCEKNDTARKHVRSIIENDKKLKKLRTPKRPKKAVPTSHKI